MNFNVYVKEEMGRRISKAARKFHRSRNSIINEALEEWLNRYESNEWPKGFFDFEAIPDCPDFKDFRKDLSSDISEDPLA